MLDKLLGLLIAVNFIPAPKIAAARTSAMQTAASPTAATQTLAPTDCETVLNAFTPASVEDYKGYLRALNHVFFNGTYYEELEEALALAKDFFGTDHGIVASIHDILSVSYELEGDAERSQRHAQFAQEIAASKRS
jgi:hypothetical protein